MIRATIVGEELVFTSLEVPGGMVEGRSYGENDMVDGDQRGIPFSELAKVFAAAETGMRGTYSTLRLHDNGDPLNSHLIVIGLSLIHI